MTDQERFTRVMAIMMGFGIETDINGLIYFSWKDAYGINHYSTDWSPITPDGELTPECRKWLDENLPETWEEYCDFIYCDIDFTNIRTFYSEVLAAQLSAENLWKWMQENTDSWLYKPCTHESTGCGSCEALYKNQERLCDGKKYARWDVGKWMVVNP